MKQGVAFATVAVLAFACVASAAITADDKSRVVGVLESVDTSSLAHTYAAATGLAAVDAPIPKSFCSAISSADMNAINDVFYAANIASLAKCKKVTGGDAAVKATLSSSNNGIALHHAIHAAHLLSITIDEDAAINKLKSIASGEYSVRAAGYVLEAASLLGAGDAFRGMADAVSSQVELVGSMAKFDGGISATAVVLRGLLSLKSEPSLKSSIVQKLAAYVASNKYSDKDVVAASALLALNALATNDHFKPLFFADVTKEVSASSPSFSVQVTDALGNPVSGHGVSVDVVSIKKGTKTVASQLALTSSKAGVFSIDTSSLGLASGVYTINIKASGDSPLVSESLSVSVAVTADASIVAASVEVKQKGKVVSSETPAFPAALQQAVAVDDSQVVSISFGVVDSATQNKLSPQQVFVRVASKEAGATDIIFVAEEADDGTFSFDLNIREHAEDGFNSEDGDYVMDVIVGDSALKTSIVWRVATLAVSFKKSTPNSAKPDAFAPLPGIEHVFASPDSRPPAVISLVFAAATAAPLLVLLILWARIGANISDFPLTHLPTLIFHGTLSATMLLYASYWLQMTIFQALICLGPMLVVLLFTGKSMLQRIADKRNKAKQE